MLINFYIIIQRPHTVLIIILIQSLSLLSLFPPANIFLYLRFVQCFCLDHMIEIILSKLMAIHSSLQIYIFYTLVLHVASVHCLVDCAFLYDAGLVVPGRRGGRWRGYQLWTIISK